MPPEEFSSGGFFCRILERVSIPGKPCLPLSSRPTAGSGEILRDAGIEREIRNRRKA